MSSKTKTQITINSKLQLIIDQVLQEYPIYDLNKAVEFLLAKGSNEYLNEHGLSFQDLIDIEKTREEFNKGEVYTAKDAKDLIKKLNS